MGVLYIISYIYAYIGVRSTCPSIYAWKLNRKHCTAKILLVLIFTFIYVHIYIYRIPETFPIAAMTAWDIVPEEKPGFCRSQGLRCSKYGVPNGMGMYMCRFIKRSMTTP